MNISAQVLDSTFGQPTAGTRVRLEHLVIDGWHLVCAASTGSSSIVTAKHGLYRLVFDCDSYFAGLGGMTAHPEIVVVFRMPNEMDSCQVQVVLAPYSHSTYLGMTEAGWSR
jgi:5-hydroxyisourate hydrolase